MQKNYGGEPATLHYAVVTNDTTPLDPIPRLLYINGSGNLVIIDDSNTTITYTVTAGQIIPFRATIITTATTANVVAWL